MAQKRENKHQHIKNRRILDISYCALESVLLVCYGVMWQLPTICEGDAKVADSTFGSAAVTTTR